MGDFWALIGIFPLDGLPLKDFDFVFEAGKQAFL